MDNTVLTQKKGCVETMITDKKVLAKYVYAFVLGDGFLAKPERRTFNSHYRLRQIASHRDYVEWQALILSSITGVKIDETPGTVDKRGYVCKPQLLLRTSAVPFYTTYRNRIYIENVKRVDPHGLKLFDVETAAIWFMDDGCGSYKVRKSGSIYHRVDFCTDSYSFGDCLLLRQAMKDVLNVWGSVTPYRKKTDAIHYRIYYQGRDAESLLRQVKPYIKPSFAYKLESLSCDEPLIKEEEIVRTL